MAATNFGNAISVQVYHLENACLPGEWWLFGLQFVLFVFMSDNVRKFDN